MSLRREVSTSSVHKIVVVPTSNSKPLSERARRFLANIPVVASVFIAVFLIVVWTADRFEQPITTEPPPHGPPFILPDKIARLLGPYSPWYPVQYYITPPSTCNITQAHFLQRHGARFPTKGQGEKIKRALSHIKIPSAKAALKSDLGFMRKYKYDLGTEDLIYFGANEAFAAGVAAYNRYSQLAHISPPFLRAGDTGRVVETGKKWRQGFEVAGRMRLKDALIIPEEKGYNNSLHGIQNCPAHSDEPSDKAQAIWLSKFAPNITARLNAAAPGSTLVDEDIPMLMSICSFESLAHYRTSKWCNVFSEGEWQDFEYWSDLEKYYNTGLGNPLGRVQGVGWVNELIARLTHTPVNDTTTTNRTLDENPETFPLGKNMTMFADFSHDNEMNAIFATMGLFGRIEMDEEGRSESNVILEQGEAEKGIQSPLNMIPPASVEQRGDESSTIRRRTWKEMDPDHPDPHRQWVASHLVPFAARLVIERLECVVPTTSSSSDGGSSTSTRLNTTEAVRVLLNDAVVHIPGCKKSERTLGSGVCALDVFLELQSYARSGGAGDWEKCQEQPEDDGQRRKRK
ncbi:hypothetical protein FRB91_004476 [Serendipita sp. 411]|nr:hypothetical protein FRB91_004476 [Serendipita sp. 411]